MKDACFYCTATTLPDGRVLIAGVFAGAKGDISASTELYDPKTGTFSPTGSMITARVDPSATLLSDGRVLIAGGYDTKTVSLASAELYDPKTGTFSPTGSMTTARGVPTATQLSDGRVLIAGGYDSTGDITAGKILTSAELYDPKTGTFSPTGSMTAARLGETATALSDGLVLIAGGGGDSAGKVILASAELYDPKTGTFSPTGSMATARSSDTATVLSDGSVLIAGGYDSTGPLASAELYDPKTGTFGPTGSMATARASSTATALADGSVLIAGGYDSTGPLASAELYDPGTGTFSPTGSMTTARIIPTATALSDGRVLIVGGGDSSGKQLASAELYQP
jgi:WD40 repeat protein